MNNRRGLGRGLGALIPTAPPAENGTSSTGPATTGANDPGSTGHAADGPAPTRAAEPVPGARLEEVPVTAIATNPRQPRTVFEAEELAELAASIREVGLLQPIVVRAVATDAGPGTTDTGHSTTDAASYEIVMGERRWRASIEAGLDFIPAIVRDTADDAMLRDALLENLHRVQLNPLEEAAAYQQLLDDFGCTQEHLGARLGRSRPQISNTLRLLRLPGPVQRKVAAGVISAGHARALLGLTDPAAQDRLATRVVAEGLSVRAVEEIVAVGDSAADDVPRRRPRARPAAPELDDLAVRLSDRFETRVKVALGQRKGRIMIEFASLDDLDRIVGVLDSADQRVPRSA